MHIVTLFSQFIREKHFLNGISPRTAKAFLDCQRAYVKHIGDELPTKLNLKEFVIKLQESGIATSTVNYYVRSFNSFLSWMLENEFIPERLRIKPLKEPENVLKTFRPGPSRRQPQYANLYHLLILLAVCYVDPNSYS